MKTKNFILQIANTIFSIKFTT